MNKRILIAGAGHNQVALIRRSRELGFHTIAIDGSPHAPGLLHADHGITGDIRDGSVITAAAAECKVDGVYPAAEWAVQACAEAVTRLGLPGITPQVALCARNKVAMRDALGGKGDFNPPYESATTFSVARAAATRIGYPLIVKPGDGNASRGVRRVDAPQELEQAFLLALAASNSGEVLLEGFLDGEEYNVDGMVFDGRYIPGAVTGKIRSSPPHRFDLGIFTPAFDTEDEEIHIFSAVQAALNAIGFHSGTTHVEVIVQSGHPFIVEIAGRPGGGRIPSDLIPLSHGMDFVADSLRIAVGLSPESRRRYRRGSALVWIPAIPGRVVCIQGIDEARSVAGVHDLHMAASPGAVLDPIVDCTTRDKVGYVLTTGPTVSQALAAARQAQDLIRIVTEPVGSNAPTTTT